MANTGAGTFQRSKHIAVRYFSARELIDQGTIRLLHKPTTEMWADLFTKPLMGSTFSKLRNAIMSA